ncbi:uncharacterized protein LOC113168007 [Anabas testudineus]|uniref:SEFIR domain-containing protein n=1 Tax=Anabas testudineus TaxID=64144 RepID=A0A3Q1I301_ANATE|nr:uncharacterized protein LOC113168007 [Anabas testudineus]
MWSFMFIFFSSVAFQVTSDEIKVECSKYYEFPPISDVSPSLLVDLKVNLLTVGGICVLNISWAINIDASIQYLTGTRLMIDGQPTYLCKYHPSLAEANLTGLKQKWFYHLVETSDGLPLVQVNNLPLPPPGSGTTSKFVTLDIRCPKPSTPTPTLVPAGPVTEPDTPAELSTSPLRTEHVTVAIFGGLAGLLILCSCFIIYKNCGANIAKSIGFKSLFTSPTAPVPVLMVYSAENSAFQQAVLALAEFLQWHGGCSVAVDMWQQKKIAELGPMRWLVEQVKVADRVLIVCPQPSFQPSHSLPNHSSPQPSIPAAAHDLYPLILNMVASHAKSASELAKFWVVQLGEQQDKQPSNLALELRACKTFCLMKNLNKLCRSLHKERQDIKNISHLILRPGISYSRKSTRKLREPVEKLSRHQTSISSESKPLKSVVMSV